MPHLGLRCKKLAGGLFVLRFMCGGLNCPYFCFPPRVAMRFVERVGFLWLESGQGMWINGEYMQL